MLIDPFVNPNDIDPEELIELLQDTPLDGVVITATNRPRNIADYIEILEEEDFLAFWGLELQLASGRLVFIPEQANEMYFNFPWPKEDEQADMALIQRAMKELNGVWLVPHPYLRQSDENWGDRAYGLKDINGCIVRVARGLPARDYLTDLCAESKGWARLGSCGGELRFLGSAMTVVSEKVEDQESLVHQLKAQVCWPIELELTSHPRKRYQGVSLDEGPRRMSMAERAEREAMAALRDGYNGEQRRGHHRGTGGGSRGGESKRSKYQQNRGSRSFNREGSKGSDRSNRSRSGARPRSR